jgi:hypothetical protein
MNTEIMKILKTTWFLVLLLLVGSLLLRPERAAAELIVTVGNANVSQGGTGFVDVFIRSTAANTDRLDLFSAELQIASLGGGGEQLAFISPTTDAHLADPDYLFAGDSVNQAIGPPAGLATTTLTPNDTYLGGDGTLSGSGLFVPTVDTLLFRLGLTTLTGNAPMTGDAFAISLVLGVNTFFSNPDFDEFDLGESSTLSGSITIDPAAPDATEVPEPSGLVLAGMLAGLGWLAHLRRQTIPV